jgi:hypothetical protein
VTSIADEEDDGDPRIRSALAEVERRLAIDAV